MSMHFFVLYKNFIKINNLKNVILNIIGRHYFTVNR